MKCLHQNRNVGSIEVDGKTPADFNGARISSQVSIQPQGHSGTLGLEWPQRTTYGQDTYLLQRDTSKEPPLMYLGKDYPEICTELWFQMPHVLLYWNKYANKHEWWRLLSGFWQDQTHTDLFYFSIIICSGCNMQYPYCNKPSPLVYHHTITGNQIREV